MTILSQKPLAITVGEPAGVGSELVVKLLQEKWSAPLVIIANDTLLQQHARKLNLSLALTPYQPEQLCNPGNAYLLNIPLAKPVIAGQLDKANVTHVMTMLQHALEGALNKEFAAIVTGPVHKGIINQAGIPFSGHTEFFAHASGIEQPVMLLLNNVMKVALVTTHIPLSEVAQHITAEKLNHVLQVVHAAMVQQFGITQPRIGVCGLNPHAGENGHLGREEIDVIIPVLTTLREQGLHLIGPLPADTAFLPKHLSELDVIVAMYHDQGLPVIKHAGFNTAVNMTLGLPFIRTSVDHGTALELAGTGIADAGSFRCALKTAIRLIQGNDSIPDNVSE